MSEKVLESEKEVRWRGLVTAQAQSGQTIRAFCALQEISEHVFGYWKKRFRGDVPALGVASSRFIAVSRARRGSSLRGPRIHLPNGVEIELGESLISAGVQDLIQGICGVGRAKS